MRDADFLNFNAHSVLLIQFLKSFEPLADITVLGEVIEGTFTEVICPTRAKENSDNSLRIHFGYIGST